MFKIAQSPLYEAKVLLFDMDGTLVDSTPVVERTWHRFAARHGLNAKDILAKSHGCRTADTIKLFAPPHVDLIQETARVVAEEVADIVGITAIRGAKEMLQALPEKRWAVVTSAGRALAIRRMEAAGLPIPKILITSEDVQQGKPHPQGYLMAAAQLNASPAECIVFEDAPAGIKAGKSAGMRVFAIGTHSHTIELEQERSMLDFTSIRLINIPLVEHIPMQLFYQ